jgi:MOSC domain-containing protein YiiM
MNAPRIVSINVARQARIGDWTGSEGRTGIDKRPITGEVKFEDNGVAGDLVIDRKAHGGFDKAVYAYAIEDALWWQQQVERKINPGAFGENLTTEGIDLNTCLIGERWQVGTTVLEISEPRIPCRVFAGFWQRPTLIKDFTEAKRSGAYLRIIEEGAAKSGDEIKVIYRPKHEITILDIFEAKAGNREKMPEIVKVAELSMKYQEWAKKVSTDS